MSFISSEDPDTAKLTPRERNALRWRSIMLSRAFREIFRPDGKGRAWPVRAWLWFLQAARLPDRARRFAVRMLFTADGAQLRVSAEYVLADLRDYARLGKSIYSSEPLLMARYAGRQELLQRLINYLNLDEEQVQKLMEIDDGIG